MRASSGRIRRRIERIKLIERKRRRNMSTPPKGRIMFIANFKAVLFAMVTSCKRLYNERESSCVDLIRS